MKTAPRADNGIQPCQRGAVFCAAFGAVYVKNDERNNASEEIREEEGIILAKNDEKWTKNWKSEIWTIC